MAHGLPRPQAVSYQGLINIWRVGHGNDSQRDFEALGAVFCHLLCLRLPLGRFLA